MHISKGQFVIRLAAFSAAILLMFIAVSDHSFSAIEPSVTAKSAVVYCENTGESIYTHNEDEKVAPYSVTKLMTALVTVMNSPLDKTVKVSDKAASQPGSSAELQPGENVTIEELLYGALVQSGNDAAFALAESVSGSSEKFVKKMNKTAKDLGCVNTRFSNPSGLASDNNYTTAADMLLIAKVALQNETIARIAGTKSYMMRATNKAKAREYHSNVKNLTGDGYIYAGKNGYNNENDTSTAFGYIKNGLHLYVIILGDTEIGRIKDSRALVKYAGEIIDGVKVVSKNDKFGPVRIRRGAKTRLSCYAKTDGYAYLPVEASKDLISTEVDIDGDVTAPVEKGQEVGKCKIMVGEEEVNSVPLVIRSSVPEGWFTSYLGISNNAAVILGIVLAVILVLLLVILVIRLKVKIKRRKERKRKIREMARQEIQDEEDHRNRGWDM